MDRVEPSRAQAFLEGLRDRYRQRKSILGLLPDAGRFVVLCSVIENVVIGLLPIGFIVGTSIMIEQVRSMAQLRGSGHWASVLAAFGLAIGALALQNILSPLQAAFGELVTRRVDGRCARRLMSASLAGTPMAVLDEQDVLDMVSEARTGLVDSWGPGAAVAALVAMVARYAQLLGGVGLIGFVLGPVAGVVTACAALAARATTRYALTQWSPIWESLRGARRRAAYVIDSGSGTAIAKEVRVLGILDWFTASAGAELDAYYGPLRSQRRQLYFKPFLALSGLELVWTAVVLWLLRGQVVRGTLSVLELSMAIQAIYLPLRFGVFFPEADVQTEWGMYHYKALLDLEQRFARAAEPTRAAMRDAAGLPRASVRFERVSFAYPGTERKVLDCLDLALEAGRSTAIVGLNGAGKTTLVKLLGGLYTPSEGRITIDGTNLDEVDLRSWQRRLAVIFQDYVHYELDARTNVALGAPARLGDDAAVTRACELAGAAEVIAGLPAGLSTTLSSRYKGGVDLSGGQWQRVALARALFAVEAGASVLVLDEPTAQLDVRAEAAFFDRFLEITLGLTTVVISHRFSTVRRADRIVVLDGGRVVEDGSHDELFQAGGRYAELFRLQAKRFAEEEALSMKVSDKGPAL